MLEMTSHAPTKGRELQNIITYSTVLANKKTFIHHWQRALAMFYITCFPALFLENWTSFKVFS